MKRLFGMISLMSVAAVLFFTIAALSPDAPLQFQEYVRYASGNPATSGEVKVYLGSVFKGRADIGPTGSYSISGLNANFPTGTYHLFADDGVGMVGDRTCYHPQGQNPTYCDIVITTAYGPTP